MTSEAALEPWDVVVVPFPYSERLAEKRRPALVISGELLNEAGFLWIAMITGAGKQNRIGDVLIEDLIATGLPGPSIIRTSKLATVEPGRIVRRIGSLAAPERLAVRAAIDGFLAAV